MKAMNKTLVAAAVAGLLGLASSGAVAQTAVFPDFRINEASIAGALPNTFTGDKITGNYVEVITFAGAPAAGTFDVSLRFNAGQFVANDGIQRGSPDGAFMPAEIGQGPGRNEEDVVFRIQNGEGQIVFHRAVVMMFGHRCHSSSHGLSGRPCMARFLFDSCTNSRP